MPLFIASHFVAGCLAHRPPAFLPACQLACLVGWLLVHVRDVMCLWGCLWKINKQRRHNVCVCSQRGHAQWPQPERDRPADSEGRGRGRGRAAAETENAGRQRHRDVVVFSLVDSGSTCVDDVVVAGSRVCALSLSLFPYLYCCVYLFSVDVTVAVAIAELLQLWSSSTRVVSLESDVTFRHVACGSISGEQTKCVGVCVPVSCAPEPVKRQQNCFPWLWGKSLNTLCRYRPNRVASFHTKHSSDACTDQVSAR